MTDGEASTGRRRRLRWWVGRTVGVLLAIFVVIVAVGVAIAWAPMGKAPEGARSDRMAGSPHSRDGSFVNTQPMWTTYWGSIVAVFELSEYAAPHGPVPVESDADERLESAPVATRVTWLGHSTTLIEIAGQKVLTDPVFGEGPSPIVALGPKRWYPPPVPLETLSDVDVVLISHDHYDHLDHPTIRRMADWDAKFVAPLGVGAHLEYWGIAPERIVELDWWEEHEIEKLLIAATPARHASGRHVLDQNRTQWAGYALIGPDHRIMFSGDTGLFDDMEVIGEKYGPFDLVMMEVGAYHRAWPDWHIGPEQAIVAHRMLRGDVFMPIHWGLFTLAMHGWTEPIERIWVAANAASVPFVAPKPGAVFEVDDPPAPERWWPELPWDTAEEHPIVSTLNGDPAVRYEIELPDAAD